MQFLSYLVSRSLNLFLHLQNNISWTEEGGRGRRRRRKRQDVTREVASENK
jgi:nicotinamide riboside kinase